MRVLVIYGSSRGGTAGLARMIAEEFVEHGVLADLGDASQVDEIEGYDAVIVGGALYNGRWHSDSCWFVERNLAELRATSVWLFSSGPLDDSARSGSLAPVVQVGALARQAEVRGHMTFGGVLDAKSTGFLSSLLNWGKPGDYRDPAQVKEWVSLIVTRLKDPRRTIVLPADLPDSEPEGVRSRVFRRLAAAGEAGADVADDLGLDVLMD